MVPQASEDCSSGLLASLCSLSHFLLLPLEIKQLLASGKEMGAGHASLAQRGSWPGLSQLTHFPGCWEQKQEPERKMQKLCPVWDHHKHTALTFSSPTRDQGVSERPAVVTPFVFKVPPGAPQTIPLQSQKAAGLKGTTWHNPVCLPCLPSGQISANIYGNSLRPIFKHWCLPSSLFTTITTASAQVSFE